jgi:hypothetical protein
MLLPWFMHVSFDDDDIFGQCETELESLSPPLQTDVAGKISLLTDAWGKIGVVRFYSVSLSSFRFYIFNTAS